MKHKRYLIALLALVMSASAQHPQVRVRTEATTGGTVTWTWDAPVGGVPAANYNFYQAPGACPSSGVVAGTASLGVVAVTIFVQSPIPANITCTWVTAVSGVGVEGPPSNTFQLNTGAPGAPSQPLPTLAQGSSGTASAPIAKPITVDR